MAAIVINTNCVHAGCSYYLMYRINSGEWISFLNKAFVLHSNSGKLHGQFLSSSWFKKQIKKNDTIDVLVVRLPRRDSTFHPDIMITADMLSRRLSDYEQHNRVGEYVNYDMLDFVVIYKQYRSDTTKYIVNILNERNSNDTRSSITDNSVFGTPAYNNINMTFEMVKEIDQLANTNIVNLNMVNIGNTTDGLDIPIPQLSRNDGSWNNYRNSFSDTDNEPSYYITCPHFTLNI